MAKEGEFDVRYYGEEIAAVAAVSKQAALDALALIEVDAQPRAFVVDELDATKPDAARVFAERANLNEGQLRESGNVDEAFQSAAAVVEGTFSTPIEIHHMLEPMATVAAVEGEEATVWASTQAVFGVRDGFARALGLPQSKVRVLCEHMGGGFGAKGGFTSDARLCGRLAQAAGAPVRLVLSRFELALAAGNRPSSYQKLKVAADKDGKLTREDDKAWLEPNFMGKPMTMGGSGLVTTVDDYMRFARMLLGQGELDGVRVLQPATVRLMSTDQLDPRMAERSWLPGKGSVGFGIDFAVRVAPPKDAQENRGAVGEFFWDGAESTLFWVDPVNDLAAVFFVQLVPFDGTLHHDIRQAVYGPDYTGPAWA